MKKRSFLYLIVISSMCVLISSCVFKKEHTPFSTDELEFATGGLGINITRDITKEEVNLITNAGFKWIRVDVTWEQIEKQKGKYDFSRYDKLNKMLQEKGIKQYYVLSYSNKLYENKRSVISEEGRNAFSKFAKATTYRYKDQGAIWEIWNEPNSETFWNPQPSYKPYAELVKKVVPVIKRQDRSSIVVAPAISGLNAESLSWLKHFFEQDSLKYIDAISVHPYRYSNPETVSEDYAELKKLTNHYTDKDIPIISGEWGYSIAHTPDQQLTDLKQAEYLVRMFLVNSQNNIPISIWYNWVNTGDNNNAKEENFGIVKSDLSEKISYVAVQNFTKQLKGYKFSKKINTQSPDDFMLEFKNKQGNKLLVYWSTKSPHYYDLDIDKGSGRITTMLGESFFVEWDKEVRLTFSTSPSYLKVK